MDSNHHQNSTSALTNVNNNNTWNNMQRMMMMETTTTAAAAEGQHDHHHMIHQIPMAASGIGIWPNYHHLHHQVPISSSTSSSIMAPSSSTSASGFLGDILGMHIEEPDREEEEEEQEEELGAMKEMMYKIAAMQPVDIDPASIRKPKRRNVRISDDPQSVAARHRRERISEKIRILQRLVPGGTKMDTASMLDEAIRYVKFLKRQIRLLQSQQHTLIPQPPHCISGVANIPPTTSSTLLLTTPGIIGDYWPFAPSMINTSAAAAVPTSSAMDVPAGLGFDVGGHGSSSFNHHEVISE